MNTSAMAQAMAPWAVRTVMMAWIAALMPISSRTRAT